MAERRRGLILLLLLAVLSSAGLAKLGVWQLHRAAEKQGLFRQFEATSTAARVDLDTLPPAHASEALWRPVSAAGSYLPSAILLDNRVRNGVLGYEVMSAFRLTSGRAVLVDRGWLKAPALRSDWPVIPTPDTSIHAVAARLAPVPSTGIRLANLPPEQGPDQHWRVQFVDFDALSKTLGLKLDPYILLLDEGEPAGYDRQWGLPQVDDGKHRAYATQWFAMSAAVVLLTIYYTFRKPRTET